MTWIIIHQSHDWLISAPELWLFICRFVQSFGGATPLFSQFSSDVLGYCYHYLTLIIRGISSLNPVNLVTKTLSFQFIFITFRILFAPFDIEHILFAS